MHEFMKKANFKGHLLTAISYLIPVVCGAGFIIAIGMAFGGKSQDALVMGKFDFFQALATIGGEGLRYVAGGCRHGDCLFNRW